MSKFKVVQADMLWPLLYIAQDGNWQNNEKAFNKMFNLLDVPSEDLQKRYTKTGVLIMHNKADFALNTLRTAGLIERQRGKYRILSSGLNLLQKYDWKTADHKIIMKLPQFKQTRELAHKKRLKKLNQLQSENKNFQTKIDDFVEKYNQNIKKQLLNKLQNLENPTDLESIMVKLLEKMGYRGENGSSIVTPKSNDGGVDCVINQDTLGLSKVLVQVKRYASNNIVDRPKIQAFYGALHTTYHMDRGIFITTSDFTKSAREIAKQNNIILINGNELADLMIEYGVMSKVKKNLTLYELTD